MCKPYLPFSVDSLAVNSQSDTRFSVFVYMSFLCVKFHFEAFLQKYIIEICPRVYKTRSSTACKIIPKAVSKNAVTELRKLIQVNVEGSFLFSYSCS